MLEANDKPLESVNLLAQGMPEKDAVKWASESSKLVGDKLNPADQKAVAAADKWLADPSPANQAAAAQAAAATNGTGPGGWTAQAAAWSKPAAHGAQAASAPSGAASGGMAAAAAAGAVMLAAGLVDKPAMPDTPKPSPELQKSKMPKLEIPKAPAVQEAPKMKPADAAAFSKKLKPFMDLGKKIASSAT